MDITWLGEYADSVGKIAGAAATVGAIIISPKLWRAAKAVGRTITGAFKFLAMLGDIHPLLEQLPGSLDQTNKRLASLENELQCRTDTSEQLNTQLALLTDTVKRIDHQVHPNGGKSLNDMVKAVVTGLAEVRASQHVTNNVLRISWDALGNFGVFYADPDGDNTYCSAAYLKWVNRTESEMKGYGWVNAVHPDDRHRVQDEWEACVRDERDFSMEYRMLRDGVAFGVLASASPLRGPDDGIIMWVGLVRRAG